jgi:hypothetical protein
MNQKKAGRKEKRFPEVEMNESSFSQKIPFRLISTYLLSGFKYRYSESKTSTFCYKIEAILD